MTAHLDQLRAAYEQAEADLYAVDQERTERSAALEAEYADRMPPLGEAARAAQKALCDAEAAWTGRDDPSALHELGILTALPGVDQETADAYAAGDINQSELESRVEAAVGSEE